MVVGTRIEPANIVAHNNEDVWLFVNRLNESRQNQSGGKDCKYE
jgi:hypothetical protein